MTWADYAIIGVIAVSVALSVVRGFMREALALAAWVAAFWVALVFSDKLAGLFARFISTPSVRVAVAFAVLFVLTLLVGALLNYVAVQVVKKSGLTGTDRLVGALFGLARGIAVVTLLVLLAGLTPAPKDPWWRESLLLGHFQALAVWLRTWLPPDIAANFVFK